MASFFDGSNPVIVYTARHDRTDNFWFTIAHEIAHVLLHLKKADDFFIDSLDDLSTRKEEAAKSFAETMLKAHEILKYFSPYRKYISRDRVVKYAREIETSPAIVVGVLQHNEFLFTEILMSLNIKFQNLYHRNIWQRRTSIKHNNIIKSKKKINEKKWG